MNSEEIAKLANVSRSTVSRVINNYKNVPPATKEKVMKVIEKYGYTPNISARTLSGKCSNIIGLFIADIDHSKSEGKWIGVNSPYNMEVISGVIQSCKRRGYLTLVYTVSNLNECYDMKQYFENRMLYGGIFIGFPYHTRELEELAAEGHNIVLIDQLTKQEGSDKKIKIVNTDNELGGYIATKYLIEQGHKVIGHIKGDYRLSSLERAKGYKRALEEAGIRYDKNLVISGEFREDIAYEETRKLYEEYHPTALFVANDIMAIGTARALSDMGISMPDDVSIVGFDNLDGSLWTQFNFTTMYTDLAELSELSVGELFEKKVAFKSCTPQLIERLSVRKK